MKKHRKKFIFIITLFFLVFTAPYLINLEFVSSYLEKTAKKEYDLNITIQKTSWDWLPSPGIVLRQTTIKHQDLQSEIAEITIYPEFSSFLSGNANIKKVGLVSPKVEVKSLERLSQILLNDTEEEGKEFPIIDISISNGEIKLPFDSHLTVLNGNIPPLSTSKIDLELTSDANMIELVTSLKTSFASEFSSKIQISRDSPDEPLRSYVWETNNTAINIDFSQVKTALLLLFNDNQDVHDVFDDIIKCDLKQADFTFKGTTDEFIEMENVIFTAEIENLEYHIPDTKISLTDAKGNLKIENAVLTGSNLSASLKNSFGTNGNFILGLAEDDFSFKLNVDIDADLSQLQETIDEFIDPSELKEQLGQIKNLTGRTIVNLKLADDLNDLKTYLFLPALSGTFHYDLLQSDITLSNGVLDITPSSVTWNNLTFGVGDNSFSDISGSVDLQEDALFLNLAGKNAELDLQDVYKIITSWPKVQNKIKESISGVDGKINLLDFQVSGPVQKPKKIKYNFNLNSENVVISSPHLPRTTALSFKSASISDNIVKAGQVVAKHKDSTLSASVNLNHTNFKDVNGSFIINGFAGEKLAPWLKKKGWFHESLFPKLPCKLSPLSVSLTTGDLSITGNIIHGKEVNTLVDIEINDKTGVSGSVEILSGKENAVIHIEALSQQNQRKRKISFGGNVSKDTLTNIIDNNWMPGSALNGQFDLLYPTEKNSAIRMTGTVDIKNFEIKLDQNGALRIDNLKITGQSDYADLSNSDLTIICPDNLKGVIKKKFILSDLSSKLYFQYNEAALLRISSGQTCNIKIKGDLSLPSKKIDFKLSLGKKKPVSIDELFACFGVKDKKISGDVSIDAEIRGTTDNISGSRIKFRAVDGIFRETSLLAKIISLLDFTELFTKNPVQTLKETGYRYDNIDINAVIEGKQLHITRSHAYISGLNLYGTGKIDLETMEIDMVVLASPFRVIDKLIYSIPIIGKKIVQRDKSILSVPIRVEGKVSDPKLGFVPKKFSKVSYDILDTFSKTFKIPFEFSHKLIKPLQQQPIKTD